MNYLAFLLETATEGGDATQTLGGGMGFTWIVMIIMLVVMWVISSNSQKKKDKEAQDMRDSLQVGDEVTTIGGIIGKVVSIKGETFVLETTKEKTHIRFLKGAVGSIDVKAEDIAKAVIEEQKAEAEATETEAK
jgi:preprotein translocase subunit YajC